MANLKDVIYLSNEDYETLVSTGTVTISGTTLTYDENNIYITPDVLASSSQNGLMSTSDKSKLDGIGITTTTGSEKVTINGSSLNVVTRDTAQTISGNKTFTNNITVDSSKKITFNDASNPASIGYASGGYITTTNLRAGSYVLPGNGNGTGSIGISSIRWGNYYGVAGNLSGDLTVGGAINIGTDKIDVDSGGSLRFFVSNAQKLTIGSGTTFFDTNAKPVTNDTYSLGDSTYNWKDLYLSGAIKTSSLTFTLPSSTGTLALKSDIKDSTITIKQTGQSDQTFTLNGSATTINLADNNTTYVFGEGTTNKAFVVTPSGDNAQAQVIPIHGLGDASLKGVTTSSTGISSSSTDDTLATAKAVYNAINALPEPMIFKGTLGTGGTITSLPTASSSNEGYTYKVITAGTYASIEAKVGDVFVCAKTGTSTYEWVLIPAGDTDSDTVRQIKVNGSDFLGTAISTGYVNFISGSNIMITGSGHDITIDSSYTDTNQKVKAGSVTFGNNDVVDIVAGSNVTVTGLASGTGAPKITISATDTKVEQAVTTSSNTSLRPIILGASYSSGSSPTFSDVTSTVYASHKIWADPANGYLYAKKVYSNGTELTGNTGNVTGSSLTSNNIIVGNGSSAIKDSGVSLTSSLLTMKNSGNTSIYLNTAMTSFVTISNTFAPGNTDGTSGGKDNTFDLGTSSARWKDLYLSGSLKDGSGANAHSIAIADIGKVKTVNNTAPDSNGDVSITIPTAPTNTSDLNNDGDDGTSPFATEDWVTSHAGGLTKKGEITAYHSPSSSSLIYRTYTPSSSAELAQFDTSKPFVIKYKSGDVAIAGTWINTTTGQFGYITYGSGYTSDVFEIWQ